MSAREVEEAEEVVTRRGAKAAPHGLLLRRGPCWAAQHGGPVFVERAGWLLFVPLLSLARLSG